MCRRSLHGRSGAREAGLGTWGNRSRGTVPIFAAEEVLVAGKHLSPQKWDCPLRPVRGQVHVFGFRSSHESRLLAEKWTSPRPVQRMACSAPRDRGSAPLPLLKSRLRWATVAKPNGHYSLGRTEGVRTRPPPGEGFRGSTRNARSRSARETEQEATERTERNSWLDSSFSSRRRKNCLQPK